MAGTIVADDLKHSNNDTVGTEYIINGSAKAWLSTTGSGTPSILDSFNTSSVTDTGVGDLTMTFSSAMNNNGYGGGACPTTGGFAAMIQDLANTTTTNRTKIHSDGAGGADGDRRITIDGDLA